jgi:hypothetical protein
MMSSGAAITSPGQFGEQAAKMQGSKNDQSLYTKTCENEFPLDI